MSEAVEGLSPLEVLATEERVAHVHRQIRTLVREAPAGSLPDRIYFLAQWLNPLVDYARLGIAPPSGWTMEAAPHYEEVIANIWCELEHRGFIVPEMTWFVDDQVSAFVEWHDFLVKISPWLSSAPQVELDSLIGSISTKH